MQPFEIRLPNRTIFGRGKAVPAVTQLTGIYGRPLIVHGANAERAAWLTIRFPGAPTRACVSEPDLPLLENTLSLAKSETVDAVIAVGGGAVLDLGKAVAGLARTSKPLSTYLEVVGDGKPIDAAPLPYIAIPTTSGTGAEATRNAVIGVPEHKRKVSIRDPRMLADLAIVDPALTDGCPHAVTMASGLDAITQLIEPYICTRANAFTDAFVIRALEPALKAIRTLAQKEDVDARDAMAFASYASGIALSHAGLGAVHGLAGVIGGATGAPHGEVCATLLAPALAVNAKALRETGKDATRIEEIEALLNTHFGDLNGATGFERLGSWTRSVGIRPLSALGVKASDHEVIASMAQKSSSMKANPAPLENQQIIDIQTLDF